MLSAALYERWGRLDIVVNNAGALFAGMVEEFTEADARLKAAKRAGDDD